MLNCLSCLSCAWLCATLWTVAARVLCPWDSPGKNTGVGCHFLLQGILLTQGSNPGLWHCRQMLYPLSHQGSPASTLAVVKSVWPPKLLSGFKSLFYHLLVLCVCVCVCEVTQSCPILCGPRDCSPLGAPVCGILQARMEWVAIPFSRRFFWPRDRTRVSCIAGRRFNRWATREASTLLRWH